MKTNPKTFKEVIDELYVQAEKEAKLFEQMKPMIQQKYPDSLLMFEEPYQDIVQHLRKRTYQDVLKLSVSLLQLKRLKEEILMKEQKSSGQSV